MIYFDGCGFGKYCFISFRLALLMPLKPSHNLLVRGSNPCGGTNQLASCLTLTSSRLLIDGCSTSRWREDGAIWAVASQLLHVPTHQRPLDESAEGHP